MNYHDDNQRRAANFLGALAHLLSGQPGRFTEFRKKVDLILCGSPANLSALRQFGELVRSTRQPVLWIHIPQGSPLVPQIGVVAKIGNRMFYVENCALWLDEHADRALLVPDRFDQRAFKFNDKLTIACAPAASSPSPDAAELGMVRACERLHSISKDQWERGETFDPPSLVRAA